MTSLATIKPPESLAEALDPIAKMSDPDFKLLLGAVSGPRSFSLSKDQIEDLNKKVPATAAIMPFTLGTLAFLYGQLDRIKGADGSLSDVVVKLVDDLDEKSRWGDVKAELVSRLTQLLSKKEAHQRFKKIQRLQDGFLPNAEGFSSFVDLRPDFNDGDPESINGFVTVIQLRIATDSGRDRDRELICQLDEEGLSELKKAIEHIDAKIRVLKSDATLNGRVFKA